MSKAEMERFANDIKNNPELMAEAKEKAGGLASLVEFVKSKGYDVSADEAKAYIHEKAGRVLSDNELDAVAGAGTADSQVVDQVTIYGPTSSAAQVQTQVQAEIVVVAN